MNFNGSGIGEIYSVPVYQPVEMVAVSMLPKQRQLLLPLEINRVTLKSTAQVSAYKLDELKAYANQWGGLGLSSNAKKSDYVLAIRNEYERRNSSTK
jgi:hypothetical protein